MAALRCSGSAAVPRAESAREYAAMIGNLFLLIDKVDGKDAIVGEGVVVECVAAGHYRCEFHGPGPAYARILSVAGMTRLLLFTTSHDLKVFKQKCFDSKTKQE